ncbi:MAG: hypothetical protein E7399_02105 [Ruminococcaceae bacterium]|nr:hypothetical protein [Oscillospiraceae bacterium]
MKRILLFLLIAMLTFSGCGGTGGGETTSPTPDTASSEEQEQNVQKTLTFDDTVIHYVGKTYGELTDLLGKSEGLDFWYNGGPTVYFEQSGSMTFVFERLRAFKELTDYPFEPQDKCLLVICSLTDMINTEEGVNYSPEEIENCLGIPLTLESTIGPDSFAGHEHYAGVYGNTAMWISINEDNTIPFDATVEMLEK